MQDSFDAEELVALARIDIESGRLESGLDKLKRAASGESQPGEATALLARLYAQLRLFGKAKHHFLRFLTTHPEAELELFQLGMAEFDSGNREEAVGLWSGLLERNPVHPPALFYRALASSEQGLFDEARRDLDVLLKAVPVDNLYFGRGKELLVMIERQPPQERLSESGSQSLPPAAYRSDE